MNEQDQHLLDAIQSNTGLKTLFIGIFGDPTSDSNQAIINRANSLVRNRDLILASLKTGRRMKKESLNVFFFKSESANVWQ